MYNEFIPSWHFEDNKLQNSWFQTARQNLYGNTTKSLCWNKVLDEIESFSTGDIDMSAYDAMFKSKANANKNNYRNNKKGKYMLNQAGEGMDYYALPLIVQRLIAGVALINRQPTEITIKALDPLAADKRNEDINFLQQKPKVEAQLAAVAEHIGLPPETIDLGKTKHSSEELGSNPYGMDLSEPEELDVFKNLIYSLKVEAALEVVLSIFAKLSKINQIRLLEITDQYKFAVSAHWNIHNSLTGLPSCRYIYPNNIEVPNSNFLDFSDRNCTFVRETMTAIDLFNHFSDEICDNKTMETIMNDTQTGYCPCNNIGSPYQKGSNDKFQVQIVYCEFVSIDSVGIVENPKKSKFSYLTDDPDLIKKCTNKRWAQNTYQGYWLVNTPYYFKKDRLPFSKRESGLEVYSTSNIDIYKSQEKSAVELSITENKVAIEAWIKVQHAIRKALPRGFKIDLKFYTNVLERLKDPNLGYTLSEILRVAFEENIHITDTDQIDDKMGGQNRAVETVIGGLDMSEISGYFQIIQNAKQNIAAYMGVNDQIAGVAYDAAVGNNQLAVKAALNTINYVSDAIEEQTRKLYNSWTFFVKTTVEKGGKPKQTLIDLVGAEKVSLIDGIEDMASHQMEAIIKINSDEQAGLEIDRDIEIWTQQGIITPPDKYLLKQISNNRDKAILLMVRYKQFEKRKAKEAEDARQQQLAAIQATGQNTLAAKQAEAEAEKNNTYAKGEVAAKIAQLQGIIDKQNLELQGYQKLGLQNNRQAAQKDKALSVLAAKGTI